MFYFQGFEVIFGGIVVILVWLEVVKMAYLVGFIEVGIEVVVRVKCLGNADFTRGLWMKQMYRSDNRTLVQKM